MVLVYEFVFRLIFFINFRKLLISFVLREIKNREKERQREKEKGKKNTQKKLVIT